MISTFDIIDILHGIVKVSALKTAVNGGLYKNNDRPDNSKLEDIVINCLPASGAQLQTATVNVNIYVPDLMIKIDGKNQYKSNFTRLKTLTTLGITLLREIAMPGYIIEIVNQSTIREELIHQHFINIRLEFKTFN
jgi:hypothetical protein